METKKGFTLLYAVVVTSILLASALSIISISLRELALTTSSRESQYAFYIANTGMECAQYWDVAGVATTVGVSPAETVERAKVFAQPDGAVGYISEYTNSEFPVTCLEDGATGTPHDIRGNISGVGDEYHYANTDSDIYTGNQWLVVGGVNPSITKFRISFTGDAEGACADVTVTKNQDGNANITTTIESRGYNTCSTSKRRVERGVQISY